MSADLQPIICGVLGWLGGHERFIYAVMCCGASLGVSGYVAKNF